MYRGLSDFNFVLQALLRQRHYVCDVGEPVQDSEYNVAWGLFHLRWFNKKIPKALGLRLRTLTLYLPQPVVAALRYPPVGSTPSPGEAHFPESAGTPPCFLLAKWKHEFEVRLPPRRIEWFVDLARPGPHLTAVINHSNVHWELFQLLAIPMLRCTVYTRVPCAGAPQGTSIPRVPVASDLADLLWTAEAVAQMPRETHHPTADELVLSLRNGPPLPPVPRSLSDSDTANGVRYFFLHPRSLVGPLPPSLSLLRGISL